MSDLKDALACFGIHAPRDERGGVCEALEAINSIDTRGLKRLLWTLVEADIFDRGLINKTISAVEKARRALSAPPSSEDGEQPARPHSLQPAND